MTYACNGKVAYVSSDPERGIQQDKKVNMDWESEICFLSIVYMNKILWLLPVFVRDQYNLHKLLASVCCVHFICIYSFFIFSSFQKETSILWVIL